MRILTVGFMGIPSGETADFLSADVLQDYDAIVVNPDGIQVLYPNPAFFTDRHMNVLNAEAGRILRGLNLKRRNEIMGLLGKGGVVVCLLHPVYMYSFKSPSSIPSRPVRPQLVTNYDWIFGAEDMQNLGGPTSGTGATVDQLDTNSPFFGYLRTKPKWSAFADKEKCEAAGWKVIASAFGTHALALSKKVLNGHIVLLPSQLGAKAGPLLEDAVKELQTSREHISEPTWSASIHLSAYRQVQASIAEVKQEISSASKRLDALSEQLYGLERWKLLLHGTGKEHLEPVVRDALSLMGFQVERQLDKDSDGKLTCESGICLLEVEGAKETVKIDKASQLVKNIGSFLATTGKPAKGILVGNPFREEPPDSRPPRGTQKQLFSKELLETANQLNIAVVLSSDLFHTVERILCEKLSEIDKKALRSKIFDGRGLVRLD